MNMRSKLPVLGVCARASGMGKTTLLTSLLPVLNQAGIRVSLIKQTHAQFDVDRPGKDSYRLREAGAAQVLLSSPQRWVLMTEQACGSDDDRLMAMLPQMDPAMADLVLVEGFRNAPIPKIEVYRPGISDLPPQAEVDSSIIACVCDTPTAAAVRRFRPDQLPELAAFIGDWLLMQRQQEDCATTAS